MSSEEFRLNRSYPEKAVLELLEHVAMATRPNGRGYSALIDTGALITGMSNEIVARKLLEAGLPHTEVL